jgi:hypothetical protein
MDVIPTHLASIIMDITNVIAIKDFQEMEHIALM